MGTMGGCGRGGSYLAYHGKDSEEGEMVLGGKWLSGELVELGLQGLGTFDLGR